MHLPPEQVPRGPYVGGIDVRLRQHAPPQEPTTPHRPTLCWAFERGPTTWKLGCTTGVAQRP
jgi:hypothetical protein